jgi:hypothetical protein
MRFMVIVKADQKTEAGVLPAPETFAAMGRFNEEMAQAGMMLAGEGLHPSARGARIRFAGGKQIVTDGPFAETKELVAGFWLIEAKSKEEAIAWMKRAPMEDCEIELRQVYEASDFPADAFPPEEAAREQGLREQLARKNA